MARRFEDLAAFLARISDQGRSERPELRPLLFGTATTRLSLEDRWVMHLERLGGGFLRVGHVRTYVDARAVHSLEVGRGHITAAHGKYRVEIEIEPPPPDGDVEAVRAYLGEVGEGSTGLRDALCDEMAVRPAVLLPARRAIRARCTCPESAGVCKHTLAVFVAFATRLDAEPDLLVRLRGLEALDVCPGPLPAEKQALTGDLAAIFGIDLAGTDLAGGSVDSSPADAEPAPIPPSAQKEVGREHLRVLGLPARTIDAWLREGILGRTDRRDVYQRTPEANRRISRHLAR